MGNLSELQSPSRRAKNESSRSTLAGETATSGNRRLVSFSISKNLCSEKIATYSFWLGYGLKELVTQATHSFWLGHGLRELATQATLSFWLGHTSGETQKFHTLEKKKPADKNENIGEDTTKFKSSQGWHLNFENALKESETPKFLRITHGWHLNFENALKESETSKF